MNTPTPRTDAQAGWAIANQYGQSTGSELLGAPDGVFVHAVFARRLERELAAEQARHITLRKAVLDVLCDHEGKACFVGSDGDRALIDAAMKEGK
jgi:hypothetical protein